MDHGGRGRSADEGLKRKRGGFRRPIRLVLFLALLVTLALLVDTLPIALGPILIRLRLAPRLGLALLFARLIGLIVRHEE